jgi:hypothetical protein
MFGRQKMTWTATRTPASLDEVMLYRNPALVRYFAIEHGLKPVEAEELFADLKRWLWLCANKDQAGPLSLFDEMRVVDLFWHTFLMFTGDYLEFCERYFGSPILHQPEPHQDGQEAAAEQEAGDSLAEMRATIQQVNRQLGPEVATRWFREIPKQYGERFRKRLPLRASH